MMPAATPISKRRTKVTRGSLRMASPSRPRPVTTLVDQPPHLLARVVAARPAALEADKVAVPRMHAGDDRDLVPAGAMIGSHLWEDRGNLRRPGDDAAGVVAPDATPPGLRGHDESGGRGRGKHNGCQAHRQSSPPTRA